jgi:hypothetical protein
MAKTVTTGGPWLAMAASVHWMIICPPSPPGSLHRLALSADGTVVAWSCRGVSNYGVTVTLPVHIAAPVAAFQWNTPGVSNSTV